MEFWTMIDNVQFGISSQYPKLGSSLFKAFGQPNGCFSWRDLLRSEWLQQHIQLIISLLLQESSTELEQPFQCFCSLLIRWCVKSTLMGIRWWLARNTTDLIMLRRFIDSIWLAQGSIHNLDGTPVLHDWLISNIWWGRRALSRGWWSSVDRAKGFIRRR